MSTLADIIRMNSMIADFRYIAKCGMLVLALLLAGCGGAPAIAPQPIAPQNREQAGEVVMYALGLMDIDYRFGGKNPEGGLDCSGMVGYIYRNALGVELPPNAARIAQIGREIGTASLAPGDLVFFNTTGKRFSHVGIYLGEDRFIHAPSSNGKIKISNLKSGYYAKRLEAARTLFD